VDNYCVAADAIKLEFFGRKDFSFHEPHMRYREDRYYLAATLSDRGNSIKPWTSW
jgi:hypothetical protein